MALNLDDAVVIICSRPDSRRLPEKCFMRIAGVPALEHILKRLEPTGLNTILAVPFMFGDRYTKYNKSTDWPRVYVFAGAEVDSPLHRMRQALDWYSRHVRIPKYVVRITHDDILIDAQTVLELLEKAADAKAGYALTPRIIEGAGVEVIHTSNLIAAAERETKPVEHVSYFVRGDRTGHQLVLMADPREEIRRSYRLTLDYPEDAVVLEAVLRKLGPFASNDEICRYLDVHPHLLHYNKQPDVTVYTCVRNGGIFIEHAIESVLSQDGHIEYIIVDDGSTDDTLSNILKFSRRDGIKLLVNEGNLGLASSCNRALKEARGRYVMRMDADDILFSGAIQDLLNCIQDTHAAVVYPSFHTIDQAGFTIRKNVPPDESHHAGCALMDRKFIDEVRFTEGLRHWDSLDLYKRMHGRFPISYVPEPLWLYRRHDSNHSDSDPEERGRLRRELENQ